ncbi:rhodanese-like domain-containing protein [Lactobacillus sp. UCMA15818]|uniref:rhodanese-like domain-containing protein n=1 Tax=Lactobacillaceae TaxID=33958 RepID=UPI0025B2502A|nr:rhodanese-like domain-containing protein [Lactobacillus sp. UCMA15818]MDN2452596.1 rhodanese-like domain-containing protein [Lactobacillus sp. UCMA15818]
MVLNVSIWVVIDIIAIAILLYIIGNQLYLWYQGRRVATLLENKDFRQGMHVGQIIDLRDKDNFDAGHIMGARNVPYTQFKIMKESIRKDMPVYLYDQGKSLSTRIAVKLHKDGYKDIFVLKNGFERWDGKIKKRK